MKAVILVGGEGTRLRPLTLTTPKPLLPIANVAFLERQLSWLADFGVDEVVLSLGYLPDAFVEHFPGNKFGSTTISYAVEPDPLGTAGAIAFAADGIDERFLVCNGDVLTDLDLRALVEFHVDRGAQATIALTRVDDPSAFGVVPTRPDGEVIAFVEKPAPGLAPTDWINAGTYVLEPEVLKRIPARLQVSIEREIFPRMLESRSLLYAMPSDSYWLDIGTPQAYLTAHADALAGSLGVPPAPGASEISPGVWVQGDVLIDPYATVRAPALLGDGARVEAEAEVSGSVIGAGCLVATGARVAHSVLMAGAQIAAGAEVIDSVIGANAVVDLEAGVREHSLVAADANVPSGAQIAGARVERSLTGASGSPRL